MSIENEQFWRSVNGTQFKTLEGELICTAGEPWPGGGEIGIVTGWNPHFQQVPAEQNELRNRELKRELEECGMFFDEIDAWWPDGKGFERSFVVQNLAHEEARRLCVKYGQAAYFYARGGEPIRVVVVEKE